MKSLRMISSIDTAKSNRLINRSKKKKEKANAKVINN